jgi:hypothetical protein
LLKGKRLEAVPARYRLICLNGVGVVLGVILCGYPKHYFGLI